MENTLRAFRVAVERGAEAVELDVRGTRDGEIVVFHDPTLRLANGSRVPLRALSRAEMSDAGPEDRPPLLDEVLDLLAGRAEIIVEIKEAGLEERIAAILASYPRPDALLVASFLPEVVREMARRAPQLRRALIYAPTRRRGPTRPLQHWRASGAQDLMLQHRLIRRALVQRIAAEGGRVLPWTVNRVEHAQRVLRAGVHGIITDRPDLIGALEVMSRGPRLAEPPADAAWSHRAGGSVGVLCLHGFTGSPWTLAPLVIALAEAGFDVELPLLPGHCASLDALAATGWADWLSCARDALVQLQLRCPSVVVVGLSMGGALACALAAEEPALRGVVAINPLVQPPPAGLVDTLRENLSAGWSDLPPGAPDIADPEVVPPPDVGTPLAPLISLFEALETLALDRVQAPLLLFTSAEDRVVSPTHSDYLAERVRGPVERVWLERGRHVATRDYERDRVAALAVAFAHRVCAGAPP